MNGYGYYKGMFAPIDFIRIPLTDRSFFFGDAVYEVCIGKRNKIYQFKEHKERLINSAGMLKIKLTDEFSDLENIAHALLKKASYDCFILYVQIARTGDTREHSFDETNGSNMLVAVFPSALPEMAEISLRTEEDRRYRYCNVKTVNLIPAVMSSYAAKGEGCFETVYVRDGFITECSHSNILIYKDGSVISAPPCESVLPGITRATLIKKAESMGIKVSERAFTPEELFDACEVFITSTTKLVRRAVSIDGRRIGGKAEQLYFSLFSALYADFDC